MSARRDLSEARVGFFKTTIEASDALEHQPTVWPVPLLRIRTAISPWQWQPWTAVSALLRPWQTKIHCRGHFVADTNVSPFARARNICYGRKFCVRDRKNVSDFVQKNFVSATNVSQFAQPIMSRAMAVHVRFNS